MQIHQIDDREISLLHEFGMDKTGFGGEKFQDSMNTIKYYRHNEYLRFYHPLQNASH